MFFMYFPVKICIHIFASTIFDSGKNTSKFTHQPTKLKVTAIFKILFQTLKDNFMPMHDAKKIINTQYALSEVCNEC